MHITRLMKCFLDGNTKSRTTALLLPDESKKLHLGSVKESSCSSTDAIKSKVIHEFDFILILTVPQKN